MRKLIINFIIMLLILSVLNCTKKKEDSNNGLVTLFLLGNQTANINQITSNNQVTISSSSGDPSLASISSTAGSTLTYSLAWTNPASSARNSTTGSIARKCSWHLYNTLSRAVRRRGESLPGETKIDFSYTPTTDEVLSLMTNCNFSMTGTSTLTGASISKIEKFSEKYKDSSIKNISLVVSMGAGRFFAQIYEIDASGRATFLTGGTFTVTAKGVTKTYTFNNNSTLALRGYSDPSFAQHVAMGLGDTFKFSLIYPGKSFLTLTDIDAPSIPNTITSVSIDGKRIGFGANTAITVSKSKPITVSWELPSTSVPTYGALKFGLDVNDYISVSAANTTNQNGIRQLINADLSKGTLTFPANSFSQLTPGGTTDCIGFDPSFIGNNIFLEGFYPGDFTDPADRKIEGFGGAFILASAFRTTNPYDRTVGLPVACESGKVFSGSQLGYANYNWATTDAILTVTD